MEESFQDGEYILTDKVSYRFEEPKRGDVIVFKAPKSPDFEYIKRIIGLPGEKLKIKNGSVYVINEAHPNGIKVEEPYLPKGTKTSERALMKEEEEVLVPVNQYFVFGDNRDHSSDSREWGGVPKENIIGRAWLRYWPINLLSFIPQVDYRF